MHVGPQAALVSSKCDKHLRGQGFDFIRPNKEIADILTPQKIYRKV